MTITLIGWIVAILVFYHKIFTVYYFNLGQGILKELVGAFILGAIMSAITFRFWWFTDIIIIWLGSVYAKKTSQNALLIGAVILAVIISMTGIKLNHESKETEEIDDSEYSESIVFDNERIFEHYYSKYI